MVVQGTDMDMANWTRIQFGWWQLLPQYGIPVPDILFNTYGEHSCDYFFQREGTAFSHAHKVRIGELWKANGVKIMNAKKLTTCEVQTS